MHWGPYSQWGVVESWSICAEDEGWCKRSLDDYIEYKRRYEGLKPTFNPVRFDPGTWARAARDAAMKYVVFTTKHHDGFSMFDILWLDGGWVKRRTKDEINQSYAQRTGESPSGFITSRVVNQDIRMDELVAKAGQKQPGLIAVDRAVYGKNQNYLTPENRVPDTPLPYPWESCIISGGGWSFIPDAKYMSGREAVHLLVDIVAKGGNLLLNVAPARRGRPCHVARRERPAHVASRRRRIRGGDPRERARQRALPVRVDDQRQHTEVTITLRRVAS